MASAFAEVCRRVLPGPLSAIDPNSTALKIYRPMFTKTAEGIAAAGGFGEPEQWHFNWRREYTKDEWLDQIPTQGLFTRLAPDALGEVLDTVGAAVDALGGRFTLSYTTVAVTATRLTPAAAAADGRPDA
ncbi:hypothetical protein [Spongiactinospora sp. TRM90649]|uniref:hypothetical protein n=1 Tax=Spongiactinospora sp. TRM90649 TaxID=3031114 RepID=UPI0023F7F066|nr:hypothetical protein [Spongiactinospora sp. TRM90649]MDF5757430.1 hypothetical protein [Spongiactinospora sp. TRM90649]